MKIHEYQGKANSQEIWCDRAARHDGDFAGGSRSGRQRIVRCWSHRSRGQGADSCRRPRQRWRRKDRQVSQRSGRTRRQDAGHEIGHASDWPRRPHRAALADRRNSAHRKGIVSWEFWSIARKASPCSWPRPPAEWKSSRWRRKIPTPSSSSTSIPAWVSKLFRRARWHSSWGSAPKQINPAVQFLIKPVQGVSGHGRIAGRNQSLHHYDRWPAVRARCQGDFR